MQVTLVDYTGCGSRDPFYAARLLIYAKNTRLEQNVNTRTEIAMMSPSEIMQELAKIAITIRSSWEFVDFVFEIRDVTRAFTHQLVRTRHGSYAQQSQRSVNMSGFGYKMPRTVVDKHLDTKWLDHMDRVSQLYTIMIENGVPTQDARGILPTNIHTNIIAKFNLRTLAEICAKRDNPRAQGEYTDVVKEMKAKSIRVFPWVKIFLEPERGKTPALDAILRRELGDRSPASVPEINDALKELDQLKGTWG